MGFLRGEWRGALTLIRSESSCSLAHKLHPQRREQQARNCWPMAAADVEGVYVMHQLKAKHFGDQGYGVYANNARRS